jgi:Fe-S cluster assembly protein SufD
MSAPVAPRGFTEAAVAELLKSRHEPEWMRQRRREAWTAFQGLPMPSRQDEEWRRTDISRLQLDRFPPFASSPVAGASLLPKTEREESYGGFLGLRDGQPVERHLSQDLARRGVIFTDLARALRDHEELVREYFMTRCVPLTDSKFAALHGAFWNAGIFLYVPRGVVVEQPLRAVIHADLASGSSLAHTLIVLEPGAQATYAEDYVSPREGGMGFSTRVVEMLVRQDAHLHYAGVQRWGRAVYDFHTERVLLDRDTAATVQLIELGARLSKGRVEAILNGNGANARLQGLYIEDGQQHLDRYTLQDHRAANGTSDLLFKGVLADHARSVFSGLIRVLPEGKGTAAYQQNRNLLLSRHARADSIPNLEIGANDILGCTHGATVGKVDQEQLFYLMSRGLDRTEATRLIVEGFVDPVLEAVPIASLRDALRREVQDRVSAVHAE